MKAGELLWFTHKNILHTNMHSTTVACNVFAIMTMSGTGTGTSTSGGCSITTAISTIITAVAYKMLTDLRFWGFSHSQHHSSCRIFNYRGFQLCAKWCGVLRVGILHCSCNLRVFLIYHASVVKYWKCMWKNNKEKYPW